MYNLFRTDRWRSESFGVYSTTIRRGWKHHGQGKRCAHRFTTCLSRTLGVDALRQCVTVVIISKLSLTVSCF